MITDSAVHSDEITIAAPRDLVWQVLVDFENYHQWNEFCPQAEGKLEMDSPLRMQVDLGWGLQEQVEYICRIEPPYAVAWRMDNRPEDPIHAVRTQTLEVIDEASCRYLSVDDFSGEGAKEMMEVMAERVEKGFNLCGYGLKDYCEKLYREQQK
jgi:uncharacterized protein YndB with AHSA1/START domain